MRRCQANLKRQRKAYKIKLAFLDSHWMKPGPRLTHRLSRGNHLIQRLRVRLLIQTHWQVLLQIQLLWKKLRHRLSLWWHLVGSKTLRRLNKRKSSLIKLFRRPSKSLKMQRQNKSKRLSNWPRNPRKPLTQQLRKELMICNKQKKTGNKPKRSLNLNCRKPRRSLQRKSNL